MKKGKRLLSCLLTAMLSVSTFGNVFAASTSYEVSSREAENRELSKYAATQGMVLLENKNNTLPILSNSVALFGGGVSKTVKGGTGSGDVNQRETVSVYEAFKNSGYTVASTDWIDEYELKYAQQKEIWDSVEHGMWDNFVFQDIEITDENIANATAVTDIAIYVAARNSDEGNDRKNEKGDYQLTDIEYSNLEKLAQSFNRVIVVLNIGGIIDTSFFDKIDGLDALVLMSQGGMESGTALVEILEGKSTPSGKLTDTWAKKYEDYPSSAAFADNDRNSDAEIYSDGIYVGYRYFDTFNVEPKYEFGYGKSYTDFDIKIDSVIADETRVSVKTTVKNIGNKYSGKEVVQVYYSAPDGNLEKPYQELAAYAKTDELKPGQSQTLTISYDTTEMASYDEQKNAYVLESGDYIVRVGNSSRNTKIGTIINLDSTVVTEQLSSQFPASQKFDELSSKNVNSYINKAEQNDILNAPVIKLNYKNFNTKNNASKFDSETVNTYIVDSQQYVMTSPYENVVEVKDVAGSKLVDVYRGRISMEEFIAQMSIDELATLVNGMKKDKSDSSAPVIGAQANEVPGAAGETTTEFIDKYGIPNIVVADGPAGIRIKQEFEGNDISGNMDTYYQFCTAWPIGTMLAMTWDDSLMNKIGKAIGAEMSEYGITLWLAPALNIHRNPLCGHNFEYYSEDPVVSGVIAASLTKGVQSYEGIGVTLKHFTANNQETNRSYVDTIVSERAVREIYLKGFEIAVKTAQPMAIMTAYNKINGKFCAGNYDLCTDVTRGEWGFKGLIMTDWYSKENSGTSMHAGNDLIMPGNEIDLIKSRFEFVEPQFNKDGTIKLDADSNELWGDFVPNTDKYGRYIKNVNSMGYTTYEGQYRQTICLGDLQKSAMNILNIILQSTAMKNLDDSVVIYPYGQQFKLYNYFEANRASVK